MIIEKVPSVICDECGSMYVIVTKKGKECEDCNRVTAKTSDYLKNKQSEVEKFLTFNSMENNNEVT